MAVWDRRAGGVVSGDLGDYFDAADDLAFEVDRFLDHGGSRPELRRTLADFQRVAQPFEDEAEAAAAVKRFATGARS